MLGHAPSTKEIPTLNQNDIPYESSNDKSNLFAENFSNYSSQFKIHKQQVENNDHNNITDHFNTPMLAVFPEVHISPLIITPHY